MTMWVTIYADASFMPDTGEAAYGIWVKCAEGQREHSASCPGEITNPELAEMFGMYAGVHHAVQWFGQFDLAGVHVVCDCKNAVRHFNYGNYLKQRHRIPEDIDSISDLKLRLLARMYAILNERDMRIATRWVKGHQASHKSVRAWVNNRTDKLAYKQNTGKDRK